MKIVVIGGSGLIGSKLVNHLKKQGHEVVAASPSSGVNTLTGEGLAEVLKGVQVVFDVANAPSFEDQAVLKFFETSGRNLLAAESVAGVKHHIALSVVGTYRLTDSGYFRAKIAQEKLIKASKIPYTIVQATQFFEFLSAIADSGTQGSTIHLPTASFQPMAADDVARLLSEVNLETPLNNTIEIAGPERIPLFEIIQRYLKAAKDPRTVVPDPHARYFGSELTDETLVPGKNPILGTLNFERWFENQNKTERT